MPNIFSHMDLNEKSNTRIKKRCLDDNFLHSHNKKANRGSYSNSGKSDSFETIEVLHKAGWRRNVSIVKKESYTLSDIKRLIEQVDRAWEGNCDLCDEAYIR